MAVGCDWESFGGLDYCEVCVPCPGGYKDGLVARKKDLDLDNWTVDVDGKITAIPLVAGATWKRFRPIPNENSTITFNGTRDSEYAALKYPINIQAQFFQVDNGFAREIDRIKNCCDLVFLIETNCCEIMIFGIQYDAACSTTPEWSCILSGIKLSGDNLDLGNKDTNVSDIVSFSGTASCRERYLNRDSVAWGALLDSAAVTPTCE